MRPLKRLLVIKHGALGDVFKALGAFRTLRQRLPQVTIDVLTTSPFADIFHQTGYVTDVLVDPRTRNPLKLITLLCRIRGQYDAILDLQNSGRTDRMACILRYLLADKTPWIGSANNEYTAFLRREKDQVPIGERLERLLAKLGLTVQRGDCTPSLEWLPETVPLMQEMPDRFVVIMPGSSRSGNSLRKRWPAAAYCEVIQYLGAQSISSLLIGGVDEEDVLRQIQQHCPTAINLCGKTTLRDIGVLAKHALAVIGNDTGPLYIAAAAGKPTHVLWSGFSDPRVHGPLGAHVHIHYADNLVTLGAEGIIALLKGEVHASDL